MNNPIYLFLFLSITLVKIGVGQIKSFDEGKDIHEIVLDTLEDGRRIGAVTWVTNGSDELQKFVIRKLDIYDPVQIILLNSSTKEPLHLNFYKGDWKNAESSIEAQGKNLGKKIIRTYGSAAMGIQSLKKGIPYMIYVQVGKPLPARNTPFVRFTNDATEVAYDNNQFSDSTSSKGEIGNASNENSESGISTLLYGIIALLVIVIVLLAVFVFKGKKKIASVILLISILTVFQDLNAQESGPIQVPTDVLENLGNANPGDNQGIYRAIAALERVFYDHVMFFAEIDDDIYSNLEALTEHLGYVEDQMEFRTQSLADETEDLYQAVRDLQTQLNNFKQDFADNMPGDINEAGQNNISPTVTREEMEIIKAELQALRLQVEYLSNRDRGYDSNPSEEGIVLYCRQLEACDRCMGEKLRRFETVRNKIKKLNRILRHSEWVTKTGLDTGNALANSVPGGSMGWKEQVIQVNKARKELWQAYNRKFDELRGTLAQVHTDVARCAGEHYANIDINWLDKRILSEIEDLQELRVPTPIF